MKLYLSLKSIPEFQDLSTAESLKKYQRYYIKSFFHWGQWLGLGLAVLLISTGYWIAKVLLPTYGIQFSGFVNFSFNVLFIILSALLYQTVILGTIAHLAKGDFTK